MLADVWRNIADEIKSEILRQRTELRFQEDGQPAGTEDTRTSFVHQGPAFAIEFASRSGGRVRRFSGKPTSVRPDFRARWCAAVHHGRSRSGRPKHP